MRRVFEFNEARNFRVGSVRQVDQRDGVSYSVVDPCLGWLTIFGVFKRNSARNCTNPNLSQYLTACRIDGEQLVRASG